MSDTRVSIKSITDDTVTLAGYGVIFGGVDLEGETFTSDTDFMPDLVQNKLVLYDHGADELIKSAVIGRVNASDIKADDTGLWIEAELDRHAAYMDMVLELAEKGVLGWSSGSVGHLVAREGKSIKRWPIVEFSLTPTPAEPRTLGVNRLKTLADAAPALAKLATGTAPDDIQDEADEKPKGNGALPVTKAESTDNAELLDLRLRILQLEIEQ